jgi:hypothetical protein
MYRKATIFFLQEAGDRIVRKEGPDNRGEVNLNDNLPENLKNVSGLTFILFWDITWCSPLKVNQRFVGMCCLHLPGGKNQVGNKHKAGNNEISAGL